jgi:hypothetical protein
MQRRIVLLLSLLLCACGTIPPRAPVTLPTVAYPFGEETLRREDVRACSARLNELSGYGYGNREQAAFLILRSDGRFDCSVWPATNAWHSANWSGRIPTGTVAVIHTHPRNIPRPSVQDAAEARRLDIPVIVVADRSVTMTR